jgi:hypothetical protein
MNTVEAVLSTNGQDVICGACGRALLRRQRRPVPEGWSARGKRYAHVLYWGPEWVLIDATDAMPAHLKRAARIRRAPGRNEGAAYYIAFGPADPLALCECGVLVHMDPRNLHTQAL